MNVTPSTLSTTDLDRPFIKGLACAAINPGLRSVLFFDATPEALQSAAAILQQMLNAVTGVLPTVHILSYAVTDDDLWGHYFPDIQSDFAAVLRQTGLLTGGRPNFEPQIITIPNLPGLSLAATRAGIMLMDTPVAHLERHGQHQHWSPDMCWLAGCATAEVGQVSPHLLDRFTLRLPGQALANSSQDKEQAIQDWLDVSTGQSDPARSLPVQLDSALVVHLQMAAQRNPVMFPETITGLFEYYLPVGGHSVRREIALARLAHTLARLDGDDDVTMRHVEAAADLIHLKPPKPSLAPSPSSGKPQPDRELHAQKTRSGSIPNQPISREKPVYEPDTTETIPPTPMPATPYPEDIAPVERESDSLRLPFRRYAAGIASSRGIITGTEKAANLQDIALIGTVLEATKFRKFRRTTQPNAGSQFKIYPTDLRRYRRLPVAEQLLVLVLDYTSLHKCDWENAILPYLRWAYINRAGIALIQVGEAVSETTSGLQARLVAASSILRLGSALEAKPGRATPLAHGLDLARQTLHKAFQHGRNAIQRAVLVIITDGRGNVPLEASRSGKITLPVNREGINDALRVAYALREYRKVNKFLLNPQPPQHSELPEELANALGAVIQPIPTLEGKGK